MGRGTFKRCWASVNGVGIAHSKPAGLSRTTSAHTLRRGRSLWTSPPPDQFAPPFNRKHLGSNEQIACPLLREHESYALCIPEGHGLDWAATVRSGKSRWGSRRFSFGELGLRFMPRSSSDSSTRGDAERCVGRAVCGPGGVGWVERGGDSRVPENVHMRAV